MLAGAYPSDEFAELQAADHLGPAGRHGGGEAGRARRRRSPAAARSRIAACSPSSSRATGTPGRRVGELDEEMVYELRAGMHGDVIVLGASSWRVADISPDRVTVTPAPGIPGKLPFWHGDAVGRPVELGRLIGAFVRDVETDLARGPKGRTKALERLRRDHDLDEPGGREPRRLPRGRAHGHRRPAHGPQHRHRALPGRAGRLAARDPHPVRRPGPRPVVHGPRGAAARERLGLEVQTIWSDDGIAIRLPEGDGSLDGVEELLFPDPEEVEDLVVGRVGQSSLFASRFRENAARALLLPRRRPGTRTPLWQQRQRSADLLAVASRYGSFPILVETYRECLADVFDLPALREILGGVQRRELAVHSVETARASAFASSLLFDYVAAYMYDGDAPMAERRAQALTLDRDLLRELLGQEELRELLPPGCARGPGAQPPGAGRGAAGEGPGPGPRPAAAPGRPHLRGGGRADRRRARGGGNDLAELAEAGARCGPGSPGRSAGSRSRTSRGTGTAWGVGAAGRAGRSWRRWRGRWTGSWRGRADARAVPGHRAGASVGVARGRGGGRARPPGGRGITPARGVPAGWGGARVLRPGGPAAAAPALPREAPPGGGARRSRDAGAVPARVARRRPSPSGSGSGAGSGGSPFRGSAALERLAEVVDQLAGLPIPASVLERDVLPARRPRDQPRLLDELGAMGEVAWAGGGASAATTAASCCTARAGSCCARRARRTAWSGRRRDPRASPRPPPPARCLLLPGAVVRGRRAFGPGGARRAVGPGLGGRGHQ